MSQAKMVGLKGLEPLRPLERRNLNLVRLPIPPQPRIRIQVYQNEAPKALETPAIGTLRSLHIVFAMYFG